MTVKITHAALNALEKERDRLAEEADDLWDELAWTRERLRNVERDACRLDDQLTNETLRADGAEERLREWQARE